MLKLGRSFLQKCVLVESEIDIVGLHKKQGSAILSFKLKFLEDSRETSRDQYDSHVIYTCLGANTYENMFYLLQKNTE